MNRYLVVRFEGGVLRTRHAKNPVSISDQIFPDVITALAQICKRTDFNLIFLTDAPKKSDPQSRSQQRLQNEVLKLMSGQGIRFKKKIQPDLKKLLHDTPASRWPSYLVSPLGTDRDLATEYGINWIHPVLKKTDRTEYAALNWTEIADFLCYRSRITEVERKTSETQITLNLNIDGQGISKINSPIGFLTHMLELFSRHSGFDLDMSIAGDTEVDEHHTVEDTAIILGQAVYNVLGNKEGITRYGFVLPMDESRAEVAVDLSGRSYLTWKVKFKRDLIGNMPTELFYHFFKSFSEHARCTLYIKARGKNDHHKIEAVFKAVARALKMAVMRDPESRQIPSSKGIL